MIRTINITTSTRHGDAYDMVAINKFPIVMIGPEDTLNDLYTDPDFIKTIRGHIKSGPIYHKAKLHIRTITEDYELSEDVVKLDEVIPLGEWN